MPAMRNDRHHKRLGQLKLFAASLWLSMVTAIFCAVVPVGAPLTTTLGSAFNPSTILVSLGAPASQTRTALRQLNDDGSRLTGDETVAPDALPPVLLAGIPVTTATADGGPSPFGPLDAPARPARDKAAQPRAPPATA